MADQAPSPSAERLREELARIIASAIGYDYDDLYANKAAWINDRGKRHDVNTPYQSDMRDAAAAVAAHMLIDEQCWPHAGEIESIWVDDNTTHRVGIDGVTRIERTQKGGMHCNIPYVRVWKGDALHSEHCQHELQAVYFETQPPPAAAARE